MHINLGLIAKLFSIFAVSPATGLTMQLSQSLIIERLKRDILPLQGYQPVGGNKDFDSGLGIINQAFPQNRFPLGAIHEFFCFKREDVSATAGFISGILAAIIKKTGVAIWISERTSIFPSALTQFGLLPENLLFVHAAKEADRLWAIEESLKCTGLSAVIAETKELGFTASRRLQLAVEKSGATGFIIRTNPKNLSTACISRWQIQQLPSIAIDDMPGVLFPRWNVELLKVRNGTTGHWQIEWAAGKFRHPYKLFSISAKHKKTG